MKVPLVSVIIPAYNAANFIAETLDCLIEQEYTNWEAIVVNDGSNDGTESIVTEYSRKDKRIILINQVNKGCSAAKNTGLTHSKGEFIQYLDADDLLSKNKLSAQVETIKENRLAVAVCKTVVFNKSIATDDCYVIDEAFLYSTTDVHHFLLNLYGLKGEAGMIQPNAFLISKELADLAGIWDTSLTPSPDEDGEYYCRVLLQSKEICLTDGVNYYRKIPNQQSLSQKKSYQFALGALKSVVLKTKHMLQFKNDQQTKDLMARQFANVAYNFGGHYPTIIEKVTEQLNFFEISKIPKVGGTAFNLGRSLIGLKQMLVVKQKLKQIVG